jgi:hypothetical protein
MLVHSIPSRYLLLCIYEEDGHFRQRGAQRTSILQRQTNTIFNYVYIYFFQLMSGYKIQQTFDQIIQAKT